MNKNSIQLVPKLVGDIQGVFYIPSYQRGYRWSEIQVRALLDDIYDVYEKEKKAYCLQPIVVRKKSDDSFELIDGQQRLTTLYIIYKYMVNRWPDYIDDLNYSIIYETRNKNSEFFKQMDNEVLANDNIDFYFIHRAYKTVEKWFSEPKREKPLHVAGGLAKCFESIIKVIWYEISDCTDKDAINLFTRLNIGRIPLTNAELVKALFLCRSDNDKNNLIRAQELALQWDTIERELHDEDFWYFLTRKKAESYPTRIELIFDFMAGKKDDERDQFATFLWFSERKENLAALWEEILLYYYRLKEWYKKDELYHKIGYLISSGETTIDILMNETKEQRKSEMENYLDVCIKKSINFKKPYSELSYENNYDEITKVLLLFNVVSMMKNGSVSRFPFKEFNTERWSLEHIHAQNSLKLNTQDKWKTWLRHHVDSVKGMSKIYGADEISHLLETIDVAINNEKLTDVEFTNLSDRITTLLSKKNEGTEYVHTLSNMALLQASANSALNNGLFDAKRLTIIKMDSEGQFIPYCTKMVFLKYYSAGQGNEIDFHFWAEDDRKAYIDKMNEILKDYLKEEILL